VRILLANWQDLENPHAGGAELHLFELFSRLADQGHRVHLICSGFPGGAPAATVRGITQVFFFNFVNKCKFMRPNFTT
jgi:hypothetical protein